jgi:hypothetical protein
MVDLRAGEALLGDTVRAPRATLRATVTGAMGATLSFVRNGAAEDSVAVTADPFTATRDVDAPAGTTDDRWRCELAVNGQPRVVTAHLWIAATGAPPALDAGATIDVVARDVSAVDGVARSPGSPSGCACSTRASGPRGAGWILALAMRLARRPRARRVAR